MEAVMKYQAFLDAFAALASESPETLAGVYERVTDECRELLVLHFTRQNLVFGADPDDDTIRVQATSAMMDTASLTRIDSAEPWHSLLGSAFGWGWVTINQQGYCDGVLLSFDGIDPTILLSVVASSITIRAINHSVHPVAASADANTHP